MHSPAIVNVCAERLALKCRDLAVAVRKQSALTLTRLLQAAPEYEKLRTTWLHAVMHLIVDREPSVQQFAAKWIAVCFHYLSIIIYYCAKILSCFCPIQNNLQEVLIEPIAHDSGGLVWTLLTAIEEEADLRYIALKANIILFLAVFCSAHLFICTKREACPKSSSKHFFLAPPNNRNWQIHAGCCSVNLVHSLTFVLLIYLKYFLEFSLN